MANPGTSTRVPCTYPDCGRFFKSIKEMKKHKIDNVEHEYCIRCDEDFEDEERYLIHRIKSTKHIVCPICGLDFRSEGGRDSHIRQNHRSEQNLTCYGCKERFRSASGLMRHIEDDECPAITQTRLLQEQSKKFMIKEALRAGEGDTLPVVPDPSDQDDIDGGVKVSDLEAKNREAMANQPHSIKNSSNPSETAKLAFEHWPYTGGKSQMSQGAPSDLMDFPERSPAKGQENYNWPGRGGAPSSIMDSDVHVSPLPFGVDTPDAGQALRVLDERWDATSFFNSFTAEYVCSCGTGFQSIKVFEEHVLTKSRTKRNVQCPGCLRIFKTTAALIAHCESASTRCDINDGDRYGQIIDELSGGIIQAIGYNPDGTVKYEAGKLDLTETTTVGVNLRRVNKW